MFPYRCADTDEMYSGLHGGDADHEQALVKVTLGGSLTDHVTQSVSNEIMTHLWQNRQDCTKYDFEDQANKSYNDTWNDAKDDSIGLMHKNNTSSDDSDTKCGSDVFDDQTDESENCSENNLSGYGNDSGAEKGRDVKGSYNNTKKEKTTWIQTREAFPIIFFLQPKNIAKGMTVKQIHQKSTKSITYKKKGRQKPREKQMPAATTNIDFFTSK